MYFKNIFFINFDYYLKLKQMKSLKRYFYYPRIYFRLK